MAQQKHSQNLDLLRSLTLSFHRIVAMALVLLVTVGCQISPMPVTIPEFPHMEEISGGRFCYYGSTQNYHYFWARVGDVNRVLQLARHSCTVKPQHSPKEGKLWEFQRTGTKIVVGSVFPYWVPSADLP